MRIAAPLDTKPYLLVWILTLVLAASANADDPVRASQMYDGELLRLEVDGYQGFLLRPPDCQDRAGDAWVWYAPTLLADREADWQSPGERHAWIFDRLLDRGLCVAGVDVGESYGSPVGRAVYDKFYEELVERYRLSPKPALLAISRGGLMAYNWAADHPDRVGCIGAVYPVCNLEAYPRLDRLTKAYGLTADEMRHQREQHNPLARLGGLADAGVPIFHLHGDHDTVVPLEQHSAELARRYRRLGGSIELIIVPGKGHEVAPELWQEPRLIEFFVKHGLRNKL
jgi:alpha-beta hydrolase superfamily lysophospholipase